MAMNQDREDHIKYLWGRARHLAFTVGRLGKLSNNVQVFGASQGTYHQRLNREITTTRISNLVPSKGVLGPHSYIRNYWSLVMMLILTYTAFITPYVVCFIDTEIFHLEIVDYTVDCLFFIDILINLNSSYYDNDGFLVSNRYRIIKHYTSTWLLVDLVGCFPFALLMPGDKGTQEDNYNRLVRLLRLPRLYKLLRVLRLVKFLQLHKSNRFAKSVINVLKTKGYKFELFKFGVTVGILVHVMGCFWYLLAKVNNYDPDTWVARQALINASHARLYISSIYWVITTLTTVGYGDITPYTSEERIFALLLMAFGVAFYSYTISNLSNIMERVDSRASSLRNKLASLHKFVQATKLPENLQQKLHAFVLINHEGNIASWINQDYLLNELPSSIRTQVSLHMHHKIVEKISFLQDKHPSFIANLVPKFRIIYVRRGDYLYKEHEHPDEVFFMTQGRVYFLARNGEEFMTYVQGSYFGEVEIIEGTARTCTLQICSSDAELMELRKAHFLAMMKEYPKIAEEILETSAMRSVKNAAAKQEALNRRPVNEPESVPLPVVRRQTQSKTFMYPAKRKSIKKNTYNPDSRQERNKKMWKEASQKPSWNTIIHKVVGHKRKHVRNHLSPNEPKPFLALVPCNTEDDIIQPERYPKYSKWNVVRFRIKELLLGNRLIHKLPLQTPPGLENPDMLRNTRNFLKEYCQELDRQIQHATITLAATRKTSEHVERSLKKLLNKY